MIWSLSWIKRCLQALWRFVPPFEKKKSIEHCEREKRKIGRKIVGCSVAADGQIMVDYKDEFDEFGDSKCSLCQRRFEEQGKLHLSFRV